MKKLFILILFVSIVYGCGVSTIATVATGGTVASKIDEVFDYTGADGQILCYKVISDNDVQVIGSSIYKSYRQVTLPEYVTYREHVYKVSSINRYAFRGCGQLMNVYGLRPDIQVGNDAFLGCTFSYDNYLAASKLPVNGGSANSQAVIPSSAKLETSKSQLQQKSDVDQNIPSFSPTNVNTFSVIIANEDYQRESAVDYAKNDGKVFRAYCHQTLGLPEKNIHLIENGTLNNMIYEIDWLEQVCKAYKGEASVIFYYAGHGIPDEASGNSYLLPVDGIGKNLRTCFSLNELYSVLGNLPARQVTVLMDACFSGAKRSGEMLASAHGVAIKAKASAPKGRMIVLSAAQGDETAYSNTEQQHGLFTYYLLKKLKATDGTTTLGELAQYISDNVERYSIVENNKSQTPTVTASPALGDSWKSMKLK